MTNQVALDFGRIHVPPPRMYMSLMRPTITRGRCRPSRQEHRAIRGIDRLRSARHLVIALHHVVSADHDLAGLAERRDITSAKSTILTSVNSIDADRRRAQFSCRRASSA